jgi:5,10-methylenetetrahydrofolate reductase
MGQKLQEAGEIKRFEFALKRHKTAALPVIPTIMSVATRTSIIYVSEFVQPVGIIAIF